MLLNIITYLITIYETELNMKKECHFRDLMNKTKQTENMNHKLAKLSIFAKIENAFHS